uniref:Uncharacterized protein n=1 Tax=Spyridia filamentosa TaxID=196632 RepID=A0A1Z1MJS1_SPYFI|nr:hypothetical protein [Spyridia filamentosa]ARW66293.1 hypothetical protein [Spyridia filamentosa]
MYLNLFHKISFNFIVSISNFDDILNYLMHFNSFMNLADYYYFYLII